MEIILKRVTYGKYDEFKDKFLEDVANSSAEYIIKNYDNYLEEITINGQIITFDLDVVGAKEIIDNEFSINNKNPMEIIDIKLSKLFYESLSINANIPSYLLYEREVWTYLNCFVLFDLVKKRFFSEEKSIEERGRIERAFLCNDSTIDRTGFRWLWALAEATYDPNLEFSLTETARQFIDPVKAIYERTMGLNRNVFKAYIRSIQLLDCDMRIKNSKYRSILPTHIRNLATMKIYESIDDLEELALIFSVDIKEFLDNTYV